MLYTLYYILIFILNVRLRVSFYCCYGNKSGNLSKSARFNFIHERRLAWTKVCIGNEHKQCEEMNVINEKNAYTEHL